MVNYLKARGGVEDLWPPAELEQIPPPEHPFRKLAPGEEDIYINRDSAARRAEAQGY